MQSKRLTAIFDLIKENSKVADIGSDHAHLSVKLAEDKNCIVYPVENKKGPFLITKKNSENSYKKENIHPIFSTGIKDIPEDLDYIVIAGMGGKLIKSILTEHPRALKSYPTLILQANKEASVVRDYLINNGYKISSESIMLENDKFYEIIFAEKGKQILSQEDIDFGHILRKEKSPVFIQKWTLELNKFRKILAGIAPELPEYQIILESIKKLEDALC